MTNNSPSTSAGSPRSRRIIRTASVATSVALAVGGAGWLLTPRAQAAGGTSVACNTGDPATQTARLQAAVNAGGTVRLAAGCTYQLTKTLTVNGNVTLVGAPDTSGSGVVSTTYLEPDPAAGHFSGVVTVGATGHLTMRMLIVNNGYHYGVINRGHTTLQTAYVEHTSGGWNTAGIFNAKDAHLKLTAFGAVGWNSGHGVVNLGHLVAKSALFLANVTPGADGKGFDGGGLWAGSGSTNTIGGGTAFAQNSGRNGGAIFLSHHAELDLDSANVQSNTARSHGGAIFVWTGAKATVGNSLMQADSSSGVSHPTGDTPGIVNNGGVLGVSTSALLDSPGIVTENGGQTTVSASAVG